MEKVRSQEGETLKESLSPEDEAILRDEIGRWAPTQLYKSLFIPWQIRHQANDIYRLIAVLQMSLNKAVKAFSVILDDEGSLLDIQIARDESQPTFSSLDATIIAAIDEDEEAQMKALDTLLDQCVLCEIKAVVYGGFSAMNPVVLTIKLHALSEQQVQMEMKGVAKEGWVKQHTGEKAVRNIIQQVEDIELE